MGNPFGKIEDTLYFNWQEVGVALLKFKGIHEGRWHVGLEVDTHGAQVKIPVGPAQNTLVPAAFVAVLNVNLRKLKDSEESDQLTLDASVENPRDNLIVPSGVSLH